MLGSFAAAPQAFAAPVEAKLEVNENCVEPDWPCWATPGSSQPAFQTAIASGATVTFVDEKTAARIAWTGTAPTCESSVPVAPAAAKTGWEGKCTFDAPGTYPFESSTLFDEGGSLDYTKYEIIVGGTPEAKTTPATAAHQTEATLTGTIAPEGEPVEYHFEYGSGSVSEHSSATTSLGATDFTSHSVSLPVTDLLPGTEYHFELILSYGAGDTVSGGPLTFTTPSAAAPTASTLAASARKETEATINGKVDPEGGADAEYYFEWGAGSGGSYEHTTASVSLPSDGAEHQVSATVTGLTPGSEYHFRLVAKNGLGSVAGADVTFMTATTPIREPTKEPPVEQPVAKEPPPTSTPSAGNPTAIASSSPPSGQPEATTPSSPLFRLVKLAPAQRSSVHGTIDVSEAGVGGRLEASLLAATASSAKAKHSSKARVGHLLRSSLKAGVMSFTLHLNSKAKSALRRHKHLALTVQIVLTPAHGAPMTVTKSVVLRSSRAASAATVARAQTSLPTAHSSRVATVQLRHTSLGSILVSSSGRTLYEFTKDHANENRCAAIHGCSAVWPSLTASGRPTAGSGVKASLLSTTSSHQVTYAGHPLYTYSGDSGPGKTSYVGITQFGGRWYAINASGRTVK